RRFPIASMSPRLPYSPGQKEAETQNRPLRMCRGRQRSTERVSSGLEGARAGGKTLIREGASIFDDFTNAALVLLQVESAFITGDTAHGRVDLPQVKQQVTQNLLLLACLSHLARLLRQVANDSILGPRRDDRFRPAFEMHERAATRPALLFDRQHGSDSIRTYIFSEAQRNQHGGLDFHSVASF